MINFGNGFTVLEIKKYMSKNILKSWNKDLRDGSKKTQDPMELYKDEDLFDYSKCTD